MIPEEKFGLTLLKVTMYNIIAELYLYFYGKMRRNK
jgi:hypothetical protein